MEVIIAEALLRIPPIAIHAHACKNSRAVMLPMKTWAP